MLAIADHFEPAHGGASAIEQERRVRRWETEFPRLAGAYRDADGRPPRHTFFFPLEQYDPALLDRLARLDQQGYGEVEIHVHHDGDTSSNLLHALTGFAHVLSSRHGLLSRSPEGTARFGFVHGDWALDNSHPTGRFCGVNDELTVLRKAGCYADFTMPCAPAASQTRTVNALYYAVDDPSRPKSHDRGPRVRVGVPPPENGLLMVQGPLLIDWRHRKRGVLPRLDNGAITRKNPPTLHRFARWIDAGISVEGRPEWIFIKLHAHGAINAGADVMLGPAMAAFHADLNRYFQDRQEWQLHYVTGREMANIILAAEAGEDGNPGEFRDYRLRRA